MSLLFLFKIYKFIVSLSTVRARGMERQRQRGDMQAHMFHGVPWRTETASGVGCRSFLLSCSREGFFAVFFFFFHQATCPSSFRASPVSTSHCLIEASGLQMPTAKQPGFTCTLGTWRLTLMLVSQVLCSQSLLSSLDQNNFSVE